MPSVLDTGIAAITGVITRIRAQPVLVAGIPYAVAVIAIAGVITYRAPPVAAPALPPTEGAASLVAARPLATNHRLRPGDLGFAADPTAGLAGRYLLGGPVPEGAGLERARFAALPDLWPSEGRFLLSLPLPTALAEAGVNAGSEVRLCGTALARPVLAKVHALRCEGGAAGCLAVLDLPAVIARDVATALVPPLRAELCPS